jgi:hypothetical protein
MNPLRGAVMDELDVVHERTDGSTPDHIIVSRAVWRDMKTHNRFEKIGSTSIPKRRAQPPGFMGMRVWQSGALDRREKDALLLSEEVFDQLFPQSKDF